MRNLFAALLLAVLILALCACAVVNPPNGSEPSTEATDPTFPTQVDGTEATTQSTEATDPTFPTQVDGTEETTQSTEATEPSHQHFYTEQVNAPTCTTDGSKVFTCECGDIYKGDVLKATGHEWGDWQTVKEPTTAAEGMAERKCSVCNQTESRKIDKIIENHTHKYESEITTQPTCTKEGVKTYTCSCGGTYTEAIAKNAHEYSKTTTNPTCTQRGYVTAKCKTCTDTYIDKYIDATGHNNNDVVTKPTCAAKGYTTHTCKTCGAVSKDTYTDMVAHDYNETVTKPTCTTDGYTTYQCKNCSNTYKGNQKAQLGHNYRSTTTKATCTIGGKTVHKCSRCSASYEEGKTAALGHSISKSTTVAPTCGSKGYDVYQCSRCDYTENKNYTDPSGSHDYQLTSNTATCTQNGVKTYTCSVCSDSYTEKVSATGSHQLEVMTVSKAADKCAALGNYGLMKYSRMTDINITICTKCGYARYESVRSIYTAAQETDIMVGLTQSVRREYMYNNALEAGDTPEQANEYVDAYKHVADSTAISLAKSRAKAIASDYSHNGKPGDCRENLNRGAQNIQTDFENWINSSGHRNNIEHWGYPYVGYARYIVGDSYTETITVYSVLLMGYHRR